MRPVIDGHMDTLVVVAHEFGEILEASGKIAVLRRQWEAIKASPMEQLPAFSLKNHTDLVAGLIDLMVFVADASKITLDSKLDSNYLGNAVAHSLISLTENMGLARAIGAGVATKGSHTQQSYIQLSVLLNNIDADAKKISAGLLMSAEVSETIGGELKTAVASNNRAVGEMQSLLRSILLDMDKVSIDGSTVFNTATLAITGSYGLYDAIAAKLDKIYWSRIVTASGWKKLNLLVVIAVLSLVAYLFAGFYLSVVSSINLIVFATRRVAQGDLNVRLTLNVDDELQQVASDFNAMTEQRQSAEALRKESEQQVRDLLDSTVEAIFGLDVRGVCTFANPSCVRMLGYHNASELIGHDMHELVHFHRPDGTILPKEECLILRSFLMDGSTHIDTELLWRADGGSFPVEYRSHPIHRNGELTGAVVTFMDISERKEQESHILHQAHYDSLTNLPNRFLSLDRLTQHLSEVERSRELVAVMFLDLDDFKKINDSLGHETGDGVLVKTAERLRSTLRSGDTVGRLGGDEFIMLLGGLSDAEDVRPVVDNILSQFGTAFSIDGRDLMLTASIGIAVYPGDGKNASELLRNADAAMYHSKELGRNTYSFFTESMNKKVARRLSLEEQLHGALDRGEFEVLYQPQINVDSGRIVGAEALLRWHSSVLGDVSPMEFIPVAEHTGLIVSLGEFVLTQAVAMAARCQQNCCDEFRMAVNISPRQIRDNNIVSFIQKVLHESGVTSDSLELEITEGMLLSGYVYVEDTLSALSQLGVNIAMDDFGTGYSSLGYLRTYPFDVLKIDRSFVNDITVDPGDRELINATIAMAHGLGLRVVAEGVETKEQFSYLKQLGCDYAQGYFFSKPMTGDELLKWGIERNTHSKLMAFTSEFDQSSLPQDLAAS